MTSEPIHHLEKKDNFFSIFILCVCVICLMNCWTGPCIATMSCAKTAFYRGASPLFCLHCSEYREADCGDRAQVSEMSHLNNPHLGTSCTGIVCACVAAGVWGALCRQITKHAQYGKRSSKKNLHIHRWEPAVKARPQEQRSPLCGWVWTAVTYGLSPVYAGAWKVGTLGRHGCTMSKAKQAPARCRCSV